MASAFTFGFCGDDIDVDGDGDVDVEVEERIQIDVSVSGQHQVGEPELVPPQKHTFAEIVSMSCLASLRRSLIE
jgi:hypothetical protein